MVGLKNFVVSGGGGGAIVANRYLNSMGGSLIGTSVLTTSLRMVKWGFYYHSRTNSRNYLGN